jgi:hypothetical protein
MDPFAALVLALLQQQPAPPRRDHSLPPRATRITIARKVIFLTYVLNIIYLQPLNLKSTASGASLASRAPWESSASAPSEGENGRFKIDVAESVRSLLHFRITRASSSASLHIYDHCQDSLPLALNFY